MTPFSGRCAAALWVVVIPVACAASARAQTSPAERPLRIVDIGVRPLYSFPDALGLTLEIHPFGGNFTLEGGAGASVVQALTWTAAAKYRFPVYTGERVVLSVGPGVGSHWLFEQVQSIDQQFLSAFVSAELVRWRGRFGFRLAMDAGVLQSIYDAPLGANLGTMPMFNSSIGMAYRIGVSPPPPRPSLDR
jgi:hypothetical protein